MMKVKDIGNILGKFLLRYMRLIEVPLNKDDQLLFLQCYCIHCIIQLLIILSVVWVLAVHISRKLCKHQHSGYAKKRQDIPAVEITIKLCSAIITSQDR